MKSLSHGLGIVGNGIAQHINFKKYERNVENDIIEMGEKKYTKDVATFSELIDFDHNKRVIYNFPNLSIDILVNHIIGHKWPSHNGHYCRIALIF